MVVVDRALRPVDRERFVVRTQAVAVGIGVREDAGLQHLIRAEADARNTLDGLNAACSNFGKVVVGIAIQFENAHFDEAGSRHGATL